MTRHSDPLFNLADALSEDVVAAPADALLHEAESEPGGRAGLVASFDRIAARAVAQSRRRRMVERLRGILHAWPLPVGLTSAMASVAGVLIAGIGGLYFYQAESYRMTAAVPPIVLADRMPKQTYAPTAGGPMSYAGSRAARVDPNRVASSDNAPAASPPAAVPTAPSPAPTAAPPAATPAPPPAPPVAAGAADEAKPVRTVEIHPNMTPNLAPSGPAFRTARRASDRAQPRAEDRLAALVAAAEQKRLNPAPVSQATALAPEPPPKAASSPALAITRPDAPPPFQWPVRGRLLAGFGSDVGGVPNNGIDLAVPAGTDVLAADDGVVLYTGNEIKSLGNLILLRHRDDFVTAYAHAKSFQVRAGDTVRRGQVIAKSGQTGTAKAPQLHFEIRKDTAPVDPAQYLAQ